MKNLIMKLILSLSLFCISLTAQETKLNSAFFEKIKGRWFSEGKSFGNPAEIEMVWSWTLQGKFFQINYKIAARVKNEDQYFYGTAYYKVDSASHYSATWFDSGGEMHPITATDDGQTLTSIWGIPGKKLGKTTYSFLDENTVEITDYIFSNKQQTWKEFSRNTFRRGTDD